MDHRPRHPKWLLLPLLAGVAMLSLFLFAGGISRLLVFPMDDAYIHFVYARNLAESHHLTFNTQPPDRGLGTTSLLWPLSLALLHPIIGVPAAARLLGVMSYLAVGLLATVLAGWVLPGGRRWAAAAVGATVLLSGNLLWFGLSGMETLLWLALGLGAVVAYARARYGLLGVLLGLLLLTRIEGVLLVAAILFVDALAARRVRREVVVAALLAALLLAPWLGVLRARTGQFMPTSYAGKKHAQERAAVAFVRDTLGDDEPTEAGLESERAPFWVRALIYPLGALGYGYAFVCGGAYLPGPEVPLTGRLGEMGTHLSLTGLVVLLGVFLPLIWHAARVGWRAVRGREWSSLDERALWALLLWFGLHNLAYWLKFPTPGTASRYQVVNHFALWFVVALGAWWTRPRWRPWAVGAVVALGLTNAGYFARVYAANVRHTVAVRLAAAEAVDRELPADAVVAAHDIGALGWSMHRRCVDLGGLIDPGFLQAAKANQVAPFLRRQGATYLVLPTPQSDGRGAVFDYAEFVGLKHNPAAPYHLLRHFQTDYETWRLGAEATWNALPGVSLYQFEWSDADG